MTKKEYTDAMKSIAASEEKKKEIWGQLEQLNLQRNEVKEDFQKEKKANWFRKKHWQVALAVCVTLALIIPAGSYAAEKVMGWYKTRFSQNGYSTEMKISGEEKEISDRTGFVKLDYSQKDLEPDYTLYTPEIDSSYFYGKHWFRYQNDEEKGRDFWVGLYYVNDSVVMKELNQMNVEELTVDGHKAYYSKEWNNNSRIEAYDSAFPMSLYVFYPEYNYYLLYSAAKNMKKETLLALADKITLRQVAEEEADEFCVAESLIEESRQEENKVYGTFYDKGEKVVIDGVEYQVTQVEVRDSLKGLKKKALKLVDEEICTKNGTLKKYTREKYETGDGIATPFQKVIKEEQIQPKMIYLTLQVKNTTNQKKKTVACMSMDALVGKEDGYEYVEDNYIRNIKEQIGSSIWTPVYFEGAKRIHGEGVALLAPNSTTTIHLGYLVDEDMAGNAYLNLTEAVYWDEEKDHNYSGDFIKLFEE